MAGKEAVDVSAWSDEELSAFLDQALEPARGSQLTAALATDAGLRERLEALRQANEAARLAFDAVLDEPVPDRFRAVIAAAASAPADAAPVIDLAARRSRRAALPMDWRIPLAASVALALGWAGGAATRGPGDVGHQLVRADATVVDAANPLFRLLNETPSATEAQFGAAGDVFKPVLSFAAADGRFCREFELASEQAVAVGVACREAQEWRVEILLAADDRPDATGGYVQASGFNEGALDAALDALGAADALGPEEEAALIAQGFLAQP
jgi:anti-sigma factor RsiW